MKTITVLVLVLSFLRLDVVYGGTPDWKFQELNGCLKYDKVSHTYQVNDSEIKTETWWITTTQASVLKMASTGSRIPEKKKWVVLIKPINGKPEQLYQYAIVGLIGQGRIKVALVSHPCPVLLDDSNPFSPVRTNTWPQSQLVLAASLQKDFEVELLDLRSLNNPDKWRDELGDEYLSPLKYGDLTFTRHLIGNYRDRIADCSANVYVITANFTAEANAVAEVIRTIRKFHSEAIILVGGRDANVPERHSFYFKSGADFIGLGDGDLSLHRFLTKLEAGTAFDSRLIPGGIGKCFRPQPMDFNLKGLKLSRFTESGGGPIAQGILSDNGFIAYFESSRGCVRECSYCTEARTHRWTQPVEDVKREIDYFQSKGCKLFMISDDNLLLRKPSELIEIFTYFRKKEVAWEFPVGLEIQSLLDHSGQLREELFSALFWNKKGEKFSGVHRLLVPLEDCLLRDTGLSKLKRAREKEMELVYRLTETGIPFLNVAVMIGSPAETLDDRSRLERNLEKMHARVKKTQTRVNFSIFCTSPLPGTPFGRQMVAEKRLSHSIEEAPELWTVANSVLNGDKFSAYENTIYRRELLARFNMAQTNGKVSPA